MKSYIPLIQREWRLLLFGFVMMFFSGPGQTYFISLFSGEIRQELSLSHGQFGVIYSAATLASAFILLWSGTILDRVDLRKFSLGVIIALALACILMSVSKNVVMLFLAILALRHLGQGLTSMSGSFAMMRYIPANKSKANSIARMGFSASEAFIPSIIIMLLVSFSWRQSWLIISAFLVTCVPLLILFTLKDYPSKHKQHLINLSKNDEQTHQQKGNPTRPKRQWTRKEVIRDPLFYPFILGLVSQSMLLTGIFFHQIHLVDEKGWSLSFWGSLFILFSIVTIITNLMVGSLSDKVGSVKLAPFTSLAAAFGLLALSISDSQLIAVIFMFFMAISSGAQAALAAPFLADRYGNKYFGSIKSLGTFSMVFMSALSPVFMGWLIDKGISMNTIAFGFSIYAFIVVALAYLAYRLSLKEA